VHSSVDAFYLLRPLASLQAVSDCTRRLPVSLFFCLSRGVESGCNNWPLRSRISDSDQSLAEMRERILLWRRPLGSWEVSLAQLLYPPASTRLLLFRNISLPIVKLKRLANKINGLSLSSETGAAAAQFLAPLVLHVPNFYEAQWTNKGRFAQWLSS
jgi:hypothetical protein